MMGLLIADPWTREQNACHLLSELKILNTTITNYSFKKEISMWGAAGHVNI